MKKFSLVSNFNHYFRLNHKHLYLKCLGINTQTVSTGQTRIKTISKTLQKTDKRQLAYQKKKKAQKQEHNNRSISKAFVVHSVFQFELLAFNIERKSSRRELLFTAAHCHIFSRFGENQSSRRRLPRPSIKLCRSQKTPRRSR